MEIIWKAKDDNVEISYFEVTDDKGTSVYFEYYHQSDNLWGNIKDNFEFILLDSPCNNAESNVFEVYIDDINERCGYMLPINAIISKEYHPDKNNVHNYLYASFWFLLNKIYELRSDKNILSDYFHDNLVVCVLHKKTINKINQFHRDNYIISLYEKGYYNYNEQPSKKVDGYDYDKIITSNNKLKIKSSFLTKNQFIKDLFYSYLPKENDAIARFIMAYQAIEYLMSEMCDMKIKEIISHYTDQKISKNDYFERVKEIGRERQQLRHIFENIKKNHPSISDFEEDCNSLYSAINYDLSDKKETSDLFYSFRNLLVHEYRKLINYKELVSRTIQSFELLIVHICNSINLYNTDDNTK